MPASSGPAPARSSQQAAGALTRTRPPGEAAPVASSSSRGPWARCTVCTRGDEIGGGAAARPRCRDQSAALLCSLPTPSPPPPEGARGRRARHVSHNGRGHQGPPHQTTILLLLVLPVLPCHPATLLLSPAWGTGLLYPRGPGWVAPTPIGPPWDELGYVRPGSQPGETTAHGAQVHTTSAVGSTPYSALYVPSPCVPPLEALDFCLLPSHVLGPRHPWMVHDRLGHDAPFRPSQPGVAAIDRRMRPSRCQRRASPRQAPPLRISHLESNRRIGRITWRRTPPAAGC